MIKKLSDEAKTKALQLAKAIDAQKCNDKYSDGFSDAMKDVCNYYDAQIDAQAKTMEELCKLAYQDHSYGHVARDWYLKNRKNGAHPTLLDLEMAERFEIRVHFYLAAGGMIKDVAD